MSNIDKQALSGLSVEAPFYLAECCCCGEVMPSSKLRESRNYPDDDGEAYCPRCNAGDCDIADLGAAGSEGVTAWNYQQKRIEALLDELEAKDKQIGDLKATAAHSNAGWKEAHEQEARAEAAEKRIAELEALEVKLPNPHAHLIWIQAGHAPDDYWDDVAVSHSEKDKCCDGSDRYPVYALWEIKEALSAIGINIAAAGKGE